MSIKADIMSPDIQVQLCGICEQSCVEAEENVIWVTPISHCAHSVCHQKIKDAESDLVKKIDNIFSHKLDRFSAHIEAYIAVKQALHGRAIIACLDDEGGAEKLKRLFNTVGLGAVLAFASPV